MKTETLTAKLPAKSTLTAKNLGQEKETVEIRNLVTANPFDVLLTVRWYMGRSKSAVTVYCSFWLHDRKHHVEYSGYGSARGYGYHKASAAFEEALFSAGIFLSRRIYGMGDSAIDEAMQAIAKTLGYKKTLIVRN